MHDYQDFRPPEAPLADAPAVSMEMAGRGSRLGAKCVDALTVFGVAVVTALLSLLVIPILQAYPATGHGHRAGSLLLELLVLAIAGLALVGLVVWNCAWLHRYGQTVGKRALRIRIVRSNGERASLGRIFGLRYLPATLLGAVPLVGFLFTLTDILLIFRESRKCLHDQFADTIVVKAE